MTRWDETEAHDLAPTPEEGQERSDRAAEKASVLLPAAHETDPVPTCFGCGAPRGARCAPYCIVEHWS